MSVVIAGDVIRLEGSCHVEDAEPLLQALQDHPGRPVALGHVTGLHLAVVQLLIAAAPPLIGEPADPFVRRWLFPQLRRDGAVAASPAQPL